MDYRTLYSALRPEFPRRRSFVALFLIVNMATLSSAQDGSAQTPGAPASPPPGVAAAPITSDGFVVAQEPYGVLNDGREAMLFTLRNPAGMEVSLTNYAGVITAITVPDRSGTMANVVESYPTLADFVRRAYVNALIGRYANRIAGATFAIEGVTYTLPANDRGNTLHGGPNGFHRRLFEATPFADERGAGVVLRTTSPDGEAGFPGNVTIEATYLLTRENALVLEYRATTDKATHLNLTNHAYFNLSGVGGSEIYDHALTLNASGVLAAGAGLIPTGEILAVDGTPFDFTRSTVIRDLAGTDHPQLAVTNGDFDHNFVIDGAETPGLRLAGRLFHPGSGRVMEVLTTKPGIQLYTGRRTGVALETQFYPDAPNRPEFPTSLLRPGEEYRQTTIYRFSVEP